MKLPARQWISIPFTARRAGQWRRGAGVTGISPAPRFPHQRGEVAAGWRHAHTYTQSDALIVSYSFWGLKTLQQPTPGALSSTNLPRHGAFESEPKPF